MKNFSSLENKKLKNPQNIMGGFVTDDSSRTSEPTACGSNCSDTAYYKDGKKTMTLTIDGPNPSTP